MRQNLIGLPFAQKRTAVFSILADKDIGGVANILKDQFDIWYVAPLHLPRGMSGEAIEAALRACGITEIRRFPNVAAAYRAALADSGENDRIAAFGSFHTVAEVMTITDKPTGHHAAG